MNHQFRDIIDAGIAFIEAYGWYVAGASLAMLVASLFVIRILLVRIPEDYFVRHTPLLAGRQHPAWEVTLLIVKNLIGAILVFLGLLMSLPGVAGQGVLTILAGLSLMNFPGKRRLQRLIVGQPLVQSVINGIRAKAGKPPLLLDGLDDDAGKGAGS